MRSIRLRPLALVALILVFGSCGELRSQVVGQWKVTSDTSALVWTFAPDGTVTSGDMRGRYTFGGPGQMKIQTPFATFVYRVELHGETMTWTGTNGSITRLTRVQ